MQTLLPSLDLDALQKTITGRLIDDVESGVVVYPRRVEIANFILDNYPTDPSQLTGFLAELISIWPELYKEDHSSDQSQQVVNLEQIASQESLLLSQAQAELAILTAKHAN